MPLLYLGFPSGAVVKNLPANAGDTTDMSSIPELGRSSGLGNGIPIAVDERRAPLGDEGVYGVVGVGLVTFESPKAKAATMVLSGLPWAFS